MRARHRRPRRPRASEDGQSLDSAARKLPQRRGWRRRLTPEERIYRAARSRANRRIGWTVHALSYGSVLALILLASRSFRATLIVAAAWGIGLALHYFAALVAPGLRQRWIEEEMGHHVDRGVVKLDQKESANARSLENLSASIAHEIRNPVTAAKRLVQQMGEDPVSRGNIEYARAALEELDRVERSVSHLLRYAREEEVASVEFALPDCIDSALAGLRDRAQRLGIAIETEISAPCVMRGDYEKLYRVLSDLISNAFDTLEAEPADDPRVIVMAGENLAGSEVWCRVRDNGPGMDPEATRRIFDPFFTTRSSGTGLALARKIIESHGGTLEVRALEPHGTEFDFSLPRSTSAQEQAV